MTIHFNLCLDDWNYCNITTVMKADDTVYHMYLIIKNIHPSCKEIFLYLDDLKTKRYYLN